MGSMAVMPTRGFMQPTRAMQPNGHALAKMYGIGNTPTERFAIASIEAVNRRSRDVSMKAVEEDLGQKLTDFLESNVELKNASEVVVLKAKDMVGVTAPLGFFDPVGFSTDAAPGNLLFFLEVELKHGRIGMLAALGILVGEQFHPMFGGNIDVPSYIAFQKTPLVNFWQAVVAAIAVPEIFSIFTFDSPFRRFPDTAFSMKTDREPGDLGFDPLGMKPKSPKALKEMQTKEINN